MIGCNTTIRSPRVHIDSDYIIIDGEQIKQKNYADIIYGRYVGDNIVYRPEPTVKYVKPPEDD
ncbi:MAG: hypothetical protein GY841_04470 [FCB group bacterium]|nr:hypothetical protein [FCB group bacterium]